MLGFSKIKNTLIALDAKTLIFKDQYKQAMQSENENVKKARNGVNYIWIGIAVIMFAFIISRIAKLS